MSRYSSAVRFANHPSVSQSSTRIGKGAKTWACRCLLIVTAVCMLVGGPAVAQTSSSIEGIITSEDGQPLPGALVVVESSSLKRELTSDTNGRYRFPALPAGTYRLTVSLDGFAGESLRDLELALNSSLQFDFDLAVGTVEDIVTVSAELPLLDTTSSDTGSVVTPDQIQTLPVNGRDYLDLMQLVPGVQINREKDQGSDEAAPILGERAGNAVFLVDGMPNRDEFGSGVGSQFNQDTILEFEVITGGFKAEFGHGSGGVVNVVTKSGGNDLRGLVQGFFRDDSLDSENSLDDEVSDAPPLSRENFAFNLGGPIVRDKVFAFGSAEYIDEDRVLNFAFPPNTPQVLRTFEAQFDEPNLTEENRFFFKLTEQLGNNHSFSQQISYNDADVQDFLPLSEAGSLPSTRQNFSLERTMIGLRQTSLFGEGDPFVFEGYLQYREHNDFNGPAHPDAGPNTSFNIFSSTTTFALFGDEGFVSFGNPYTDSEYDQEYIAIGPSLSKTFGGGDHQVKVGIDYLSTEVQGNELSVVVNQLFATADNFARFGPVFSGLFTLAEVGARTPQGELVNLDNDYFGVYIQDDWRIGNTLTLNFGVRWDRDSEFEDDDNIAPRFGFAWNPTTKTVISGSAGIYYDRFRLGLVRNVPAFGGADMELIQDLSYPQGFYNTTTIIPIIAGVCINPAAPQAAVEGTPCPFGLPTPHLGFDYINTLVAPGRDPIPAESIITRDNIMELSGLSPDEFLERVNATVPLLAFGDLGWYWGPFGALTHTLLPAGPFPVTIDPSFETPSTDAYHLGIQQQIGRNHLVSLDYHHREINNILGIRETNLEFISRIPGFERTYSGEFSGTGIRGFGPWFEGEYDSVIVGYTKRMSDRFTISAHYTYTDAVDNLVSAQLGDGGLGTGGTGTSPTDAFVGIVPEVTDPTTGQNNANGSFTAGNGNFIPQAGTFYNGPDLDKGPSSLSVDDQIVVFGLVELPWQMQLSAIYRYQSGFRFSESAEQLADPDGNLSFVARDITQEKNSLEGPSYRNLDIRLGKLFNIGDRVRATVLVEFFNVLNEQNAAAVETFDARPTPLGQALQVLPGREGQIGFRLEF